MEEHICERCGKEMRAFIMSWWTTEDICISCSQKETKLRRLLRKRTGYDMEGCGYIPFVAAGLEPGHWPE